MVQHLEGRCCCLLVVVQHEFMDLDCKGGFISTAENVGRRPVLETAVVSTQECAAPEAMSLLPKNQPLHPEKQIQTWRQSSGS